MAACDIAHKGFAALSQHRRSTRLRGAAGAIGQRLIPQLVVNGHEVTATTRSSRKFDDLRALGADPVALDGLDAAAVGEAVSRAEPDVIVHQMSALAGGNNLKKFDEWFHTANQLRTAGTKHLLAAADAAGVKKFVAQSYTGWTNPCVGGPVRTEKRPARSRSRQVAA